MTFPLFYIFDFLDGVHTHTYTVAYTYMGATMPERSIIHVKKSTKNSVSR